MKLKFTKMHGAGNDFIVFNAIEQDLSALTADDWRALGRGELDDEQVKAMLEEGYEAICGDDDKNDSDEEAEEE